MCNALLLTCLGFAAFPCSLFLLGWNENNSVCENKRILHADKNADVAPCNRAELSKDGFVFFSCPILPSSLEAFGPCAFNSASCSNPDLLEFKAVSAKQVAEVYICKEQCRNEQVKNTKSQNVQVRTCDYSMTWSTTTGPSTFERALSEVSHGCPDILVAGGNVAHAAGVDLGSRSRFAGSVLVGESDAAAYSLNSELIKELHPDTRVDLSAYASNFTGSSTGLLPWSRTLTSFSSDSWLVSNRYLMSCNVQRIGCVRISYYKSSATSPSVLTHVTKDTGRTSPETIQGSWGCSRSTWQEILQGSYEKAAMIEELQRRNSLWAWVLRGVGLAGAWLAVYCCLQPLAAAADAAGDVLNWLPCGGFLQDFIEGMAQAIVCALSCSCGCCTGLLVIALVWLFMRPLISGSLIAICMVLTALIGVAVKTHRDQGKSNDVEMPADKE